MRATRVSRLAVAALVVLVACGGTGTKASKSGSAGAGAAGAAAAGATAAASPLKLLIAWEWSPPPRFSAGMPVSDGREIALTSEHHLVFLLDAAGAVRWRVERRVRDVAPALTADLVLVPTEDGLLALDRATGRVRWTATLGDRTNTPAVAGGRAVVTTWDGELAAVDLADGTVAWRVKLGGDALGPPAVLGSTAVATFDTGRVAGAVAVDVAGGRQQWAVGLPADGVSGPAIVAGGGVAGPGVVVVVAADLAAHGLALDTGAEKWRTPLDGSGSPEVTPLAQGDGSVLVGHRLGGMALLEARDGRVRWDTPAVGAAVRGGPAGPGPNGWFAMPLHDGRVLLGGPDREPDIRQPPSLANGVAEGPGGVLLVATAQGKENRLTAMSGW